MEGPLADEQDVLETDAPTELDPADSPAWGGETAELPEDPQVYDYDWGSSVVLIDDDYSGSWDHASIDLDGDGVPEVVASVLGGNVSLAFDHDGDGAFEHVEIISREQLAVEEPELDRLLDTGFGPYPEEGALTPVQLDPATMAEESPYWFEQAANGLSVPAAVAQIVSQYGGVVFDSEEAFVDLANELGLFMVGMDGLAGLTAPGALALMEGAGVPATMMVGANLDVLESYIDQGHGVIVAVDADSIWHGEEGDAADHVVVISDIDRENGVAVLSDPGIPDGNGLTVPLETLEDAWSQSGNTMIVAEEPAPAAGPGVDGAGELDPSGSVVATPVEQAPPSAEDAGPALDESDDTESVPETEGTPETESGSETESAPEVELSSLSIPDAISRIVGSAAWVLLPVVIDAAELSARR